MHPRFQDVLAKIIPILSNSDKKICIPQSCRAELIKHISNPANNEAYDNAKKALTELNRIDEFVTYFGDETDSQHADNVFLSRFAQFRSKYHLYLITEDKNLRRDICRLNDSKSVSGKTIEVVNIDYILNYRSVSNRCSIIEKKKGFKFRTSLTSILDDVLKLENIPVVGQSVYDDSGNVIRLISTIKAGGEGTVYNINIDGNFVAKIYHKGKMTRRHKEKIDLLVHSGISIPGVCFPTKCLYNSSHDFVGYVMPRANVNAKSLESSIFKGERGINRYFKGLSRQDLVEIAINIFDKIAKLHEYGVILGDINGSNILISSPNEIYFVDTDSYQIEDLPCPVGTEDFTAPEIQNKDYKTFLRTIGNENFAVAVLLFRILMLGQNPYAHINGNTPAKNIEEGNFSYPYKENSNGLAPNSDAKFIWSHMFFPLKQMFYFTFKKGQCYYEEYERPTASWWLSTLKKYKKELTDGTIKNYDPVSLELIPKSYKKIPNVNYIKCKLCGYDVSEDYTKEGYCYTCLNKSTIVKCSKCGTDIPFKNYNKYIKKIHEPTLCNSCFQIRQKLKDVYTNEWCNCCGKSFIITYGEREFFVNKGLSLPKRCPNCRKAGRRPVYEEQKTYYENSGSSGGSGSSSSSGWCYLTTVACEFYGKPNDCYELSVLRYYRDNWLAKQEGGIELIRQYYDCAPSMVSAIKSSPEYAHICTTIMNEYINPCINLINIHHEQACKELYLKMVYALKKKLGI
jgi:serine/threonine protein kinase/rRNA-processing protein FCF1